MEKAAYEDGALPKKQKELIAVGISVVIDCESCMQWHIEQAAKAGATQQEVLEAVEVGIEMGGGPATVSARFALDVMDRVFAEQLRADENRCAQRSPRVSLPSASRWRRTPAVSAGSCRRLARRMRISCISPSAR